MARSWPLNDHQLGYYDLVLPQTASPYWQTGRHLIQNTSSINQSSRSCTPPPPLCPIVYWWITSHHTLPTPCRHHLFSFIKMQPAEIDDEKTEEDFRKPTASSLSHRQVSFSQAPCLSPLFASRSCFFLCSMLLKVGTSNPLLNLLNGVKPIYQLTHFRWIIYPFIFSNNATYVTRGAKTVISLREGKSYFFALFLLESFEPFKTRCCYIVLYCCC